MVYSRDLFGPKSVPNIRIFEGGSAVHAQNRVRTGQEALIWNFCIFDNRLEIINFVYYVQILSFSEFFFRYYECAWILDMNQQKYLTSESEV